jgi:hypothetical protein
LQGVRVVQVRRLVVVAQGGTEQVTHRALEFQRPKVLVAVGLLNLL